MLPNWRRHKPTASNNIQERHLKLRERRNEMQKQPPHRS
uniref:Uncharacterized protein n=1 Tax=Arundo donax TaxID=35708 RepID=A0A0A9GEN3_ARUDO